MRKRVDEFKQVIFLILARAERLKLSPGAAAIELQSQVLDVYKLKSLRALRDWAPMHIKTDWDRGKQLKSQAAGKGAPCVEMPTPSPLKRLRSKIGKWWDLFKAFLGSACLYCIGFLRGTEASCMLLGLHLPKGVSFSLEAFCHSVHERQPACLLVFFIAFPILTTPPHLIMLPGGSSTAAGGAAGAAQPSSAGGTAPPGRLSELGSFLSLSA